MECKVHPLVGKLIIKQRTQCLRDRQMAAKLGVSISLWRKLRYGERRLSLVLLQGITRSFPELTADLLFYLGENAPTVTSQRDSQSMYVYRRD